MHFWFNIKSGKSGDYCQLSNSIFPNSFFESKYSKESRAPQREDLPPNVPIDIGIVGGNDNRDPNIVGTFVRVCVFAYVAAALNHPPIPHPIHVSDFIL